MTNNNTEQTVYILQKDLPNVNAGAEIKLSRHGNCYNCIDKNGLTASFQRKLIECNPEWFKKEQPKPDWEILSFQDYKNTGEYFTRCHDAYWRTAMLNSAYTIDKLLKENYPIHSVKRLSDGEVFSVGDKVNCDKCPESFSKQTIEKFIIADKGFMIASCGGVATSIKNISKIPPKEEQVPIKVEIEGKYIISKTIGSQLLVFKTNCDFPPEKMKSIKEAIEGVLNGDNGNLISLLRDCVSATWGCKDFKHTQDMFDKFLSDRKLLKKSI